MSNSHLVKVNEKLSNHDMKIQDNQKRKSINNNAMIKINQAKIIRDRSSKSIEPTDETMIDHSK
jgi:hypothetical protein